MKQWQAVVRSVASVAMGAMVMVVLFFVKMDVLKYGLVLILLVKEGQ